MSSEKEEGGEKRRERETKKKGKTVWKRDMKWRGRKRG